MTGDGTGIPERNSIVTFNIDVKYDGEQGYKSEKPLVFILDEYTLPPVIVDVIGEMKREEECQITTTRSDVVLKVDFEDEAVSEIFVKSKAESASVITIFLHLVNYETPESVHGLHLEEKRDRLLREKSLGTRFFKQGKYEKALEFYQRILSHFTLDDLYNNLKHEDPESSEWLALKTELDLL